MTEPVKVMLRKLRQSLKLVDSFSGELRINYHKGEPSKKIKKVEVLEVK